MTYYRRKEQPIQAIQWLGTNYAEMANFTAGNVAISADQSVLFVGGNQVLLTNWVLKMVGQENSAAPTTTRYRVMRDNLFQAQFEPTDYVPPPSPIEEPKNKGQEKK